MSDQLKKSTVSKTVVSGNFSTAISSNSGRYAIHAKNDRID